MSEQVEIVDYQSGSRWRRLGVTMTLRMILVAFIPLITAAVAVLISLSGMVENLTEGMRDTRKQMAQSTVSASLQNQAKFTMDEIDDYVYAHIQDVVEWANAPVVRQAAQDGAVRANELGLTKITLDQVELRMDETRALVDDDTQLRVYLRNLSMRHSAFTEIFLTDEYGFTVSYDRKPSDFVQSDEVWWNTAWEAGRYIGQIKYDDDLGIHVIDIALRVDSGSGGKHIGVLKAALDIRALQDLVVEAAEHVPGGSVHLFTQQGDQIADTASDNNAAIIMTSEGNLLQQGWIPASLIIEQDAGESGYLLDQENLDGEPIALGYASSAPGAVYGMRSFGGLGWFVTVEQTEEAAFAPLWRLDDEITRVAGQNNRILTIVLVIGIATAAGSIIVALLAARTIVHPIERMAEISQRVAAGDFGVELQVEQRNEIGQLQNAFLQMTAQLRRMLDSERKQHERLQMTVAEYMTFVADVATGNLSTRLNLDSVDQLADPLVALGHNLDTMVDRLYNMTIRVKEATQSLSSTSSEILAVTTQQASGASEQSAAIAQTTTTVDELKAIAEQSVSRAHDVAGASQRTIDVSRAGQRAVQDTIGSMARIKVQVEGIAENILALSEQTQQIGEIIATVNDIAAQSNILALNASVEAARAGEYGKGFAVVAVEVRNLAEQSRQATAQVRAILSDIQKATNATVMATEEGTKGVDEGVHLVAQAQEAIEQLGAMIEESTQAATQMVAGGRQQSAGVEQVALAMQNINQATVQSLSSTRQAEKAARDLNELANSLAKIVEQYKL
ncbi:MAG: HAMP domain-containing protein [Chloroflexi bacterium]|nr:HAMP domain-containing protein [Chloroflexota bacterium]